MHIRGHMKGLAVFLGLFLAVSSVAVAQNSDVRQKAQDVKQDITGAINDLDAQKIDITATDYKFVPSEFTVPAGKKVVVTLTNSSKHEHNIQFDLPDNQKLKLTNNLRNGESGTLEFTAPGPGTYSFKCPVDLHSTLGMKGKMIVQ